MKRDFIHNLGDEEWKVLDWSFKDLRKDYAVSTHGRVKSIHKVSKQERLLKGSICMEMKRISIVSKKVGSRHFYVHRLVANAFLSKPLDNQRFVCHLDGDKLNNSARNLRWMSQSELDIYRASVGLEKRAAQTKLTEVDVLEIKRLFRDKDLTNKQIAAEFKVSTEQIRKIRKGVNWKHVILRS